MGHPLPSTSDETRNAVTRLLATSPPILVEVRFPNAATSPDWHLCEDEEQFDHILDSVGPGSELHISSVWDLKNPKGDLCLRK